MPKLTNIKSIGSGKYRVLIDDEKYILYEDILIEEQLLKPCDISIEKLAKIKSKNEYYQAYYKIIKYLSYSLRTKKEIIIKLRTLGVDNENIYLIIDRLEKEGYLDSNKYIKAYINDHINLSLDGPNKIFNDLVNNGFNEKVIYEYLDIFDDELWTSRVKKIIEKKIKSNHKYSSSILKQTIKKELIQKGYNSFLDLVNDITFNDDNIYEKEYQKVYEKLSKKYNGEELKFKIKQKMYSKGFFKE